MIEQKKITIRLPDEIHNRLKATANKQRKTILEIIISILNAKEKDYISNKNFKILEKVIENKKGYSLKTDKNQRLIHIPLADLSTETIQQYFTFDEKIQKVRLKRLKRYYKGERTLEDLENSSLYLIIKKILKHV